MHGMPCSELRESEGRSGDACLVLHPIGKALSQPHSYRRGIESHRRTRAL